MSELIHRGPAKVGLVLSGGGARGAYQAGVLKAISEIALETGNKHPFPIMTGVSAGAINASYLAAMADDLIVGCRRMTELWKSMTPDQVFRTDAISAGAIGLRLLRDTALGSLSSRKLARSLLNTAPLKELLAKTIPFEKIRDNLQSGSLSALAVTAMNYNHGTSVTFVEADPDTPMWTRSTRRSQLSRIGTEHVMASAALPLFFSPAAVGADYFGDGCLRNTAPLSPAIHLGADRLLVISVRRADTGVAAQGLDIEPTLARVLGVILNALLLDATDIDMERMSRVNQTLDFVPEHQRQDLNLRKIQYLWLRPSRDVGALAGDLHDRLPKVIRYLVGGLGSSREAAELTSYLLFDPEYCGELVRIGYEDGLAQSAEIKAFLQDP